MPVVGVVKLGAESLLPVCNEFRLIPSDRHNLCGRAYVSIRPRTQRVLRRFARWAQHHGFERSGPRTELEYSSSSARALLYYPREWISCIGLPRLYREGALTFSIPVAWPGLLLRRTLPRIHGFALSEFSPRPLS